MASSSRLLYDYTEGATADDIRDAVTINKPSRRDSRYSPYDDDHPGSIFDGPGSTIIPSSVSRMSQDDSRRRSMEFPRTRRSSLGGRSIDSRRSGGIQRTDSGQTVDSDVPSHDDVSYVDNWSQRRSRSPPARTSVFENIANIFGRSTAESPVQTRRPSLSRGSSSSRRIRRTRSRTSSDYAIDDDTASGDERWGYSSGEDDDEEADQDSIQAEIAREGGSDLDSYPPTPTNLPLLVNDPIFGGETRIDMGAEFEPLDPPPPGPPSRQTIYVSDEDVNIRFVGYEVIRVRQALWRVCCILSFGILALLGHWFPRLWLRWVAQERAFMHIEHGFVVVETAYRDIALFPVEKIGYPYDTSTVFNTPSSIEDTTDEKIGNLLVVDYRYARFALDPRTGLFSMVSCWRDSSWNGLTAIKDGLNPTTRTQRSVLFGPNSVDIQGKSTVSLLIDEVIHPFYIFQIASIILWSLDDYYYYAFCIALISVVSIVTTLIDTKKTIARMREMSRFRCPVNVLIDGAWVEKDSSELVIGDIINLISPQLGFIPADLFLLTGDTIVNESMLTGESVPVSKTPASNEDIARWKDSEDVSRESAKSFLYCGTRVVRTRGSLAPDGSIRNPAVGLVVRTGFATTKGALIRSMLFPKPIGFKFYRDSVRFIGVLAGIAGLGFSASAVQFINLGVPWHTILVRALDLITVVVPPALPATLSIGTSFAINRLRKQGIFCISPSRVNVAGKINVCCFDKTGTLTEDGLDILGIRGLDRQGGGFGELIDDVYDLPQGRSKANFHQALATCHSLKMVDGVPIGDPLDVKMFTFTRWTLEEGLNAGMGKIKGPSGMDQPAALVQTVVRPPGTGQFRLEDALRGGGRHAYFLELGVIRTFEFSSALRRMGAIVKRLRSNTMEVYVKGAPEVMGDICEKDSFPQDYDDLLSYYTRAGYRVIAVAGKSIEGLSWLKAQRMKREQAESGLRFLGLVIFENKLKPGTTPAILSLRSAHLACRMITGDNPLTAVSVARECGLISEAAHVFTPVFIRGNSSTPLSKLQWSSMDEPTWMLDDYSLKPLAPPPHHGTDPEELSHQDYALALTGDVFRWMINHAPLETLQRMLVKTQIFARMSPDEKNEVVERLQSLGYTVLMCGDGANDCAALKAADVGISLSEAEASVAAPFTSRTPDISCVLDVIKEGRAALVTSFSCFKYMALYSLIQFTTITLLYSFASSLGDFQFLYIDLFIIIPVAVAMARTLPYPALHTKRPTASLVSKKVLTSIIGQIIITAVAQFWAFYWVRAQTWYTPPPPYEPGNADKLESTNFENSALFLVSSFQYVLTAAVFSIGPPFRKSMWTNGWLIFSLGILGLINTVILLSPPKFVLILLELMILPYSARTTLLTGITVNIIVSVIFERWGAQYLAQIVGSLMKMYQEHRRIRLGKAYKLVDGR